MPETRRLVVEAALDELFGKNWFDICAMRKIAEIVGAPTKSEAFGLLDALHCVNYANMRPELRERIPQLVAEALRGGEKNVATEFVMKEIDLG